MLSKPLACRWALALLTTGWLAGAAAGAPPTADPAPADSAPAAAPMLPPARPGVLDRPVESPPAAADGAAAEKAPDNPPLPPLGFTGKSSVVPRDVPEGQDFVPVEDRWRIGFPYWDRYGWNFPVGLDYPSKLGHWWDPYNQNVLKGDYPIIGQNTFLNLTATSFTLVEPRHVPTPSSGGFESSARPFEEEFFGRPNQFQFAEYLKFSVDLFHGNTSAFKPIDWRVKLTPIFNVNRLDVQELAIVNPDVRKGSQRDRTFFALEEYFVESKLADLSPNYDFVSARIGSQFFTSDFRGFIFSQTNRAVRLFGTLDSNRDQFNVLYFRPAEKDINSALNTMRDRRQDIFIANYYRQDFIWPGYTAQVSVHFNHDQPSFIFDQNTFLARPDAVGTFTPHQVDVAYLGWTGDGHINRFNVDHAFYWAVGRDSNNPLANQAQDISAYMAALEVSYDRDWARFRTSFFFASGDANPNNTHACGFDSIFDNPNFAGGAFSYWQRQNIPLLGVNLVQRESLLPDLRSSKLQGQSNFVNPGLWLFNLGFDADITPKMKSINNVNFLWFDQTDVLDVFTYQGDIRRFIGADLSSGLEYRPLLNNNIIMTFGVATLLPGGGFQDIFNRLNNRTNPLYQAFLELTLTY